VYDDFVGVEGVFIIVDNNEVIQIWLLWYFIIYIFTVQGCGYGQKASTSDPSKAQCPDKVCFTVIMVMPLTMPCLALLLVATFVHLF